MKRIGVTMAALSLAALTACATGPRLSDEQRLELYRTHAGEPVPGFHYFRSLNGWMPLGDEALTVWTRPREAYLLELSGPCLDLEFAPAISITNQFGRVDAGFDRVIVLQRNSPTFPCRIEQIRPVDLEAVEQAEDEMRKSVEMVERDQPAGESSEGGT